MTNYRIKPVKTSPHHQYGTLQVRTYKSVSAFAPIANPLKAPWGEKAFKGYFGESNWQSKGAEHDSTELLKKWKGGPLDILIDVVSTQAKL